MHKPSMQRQEAGRALERRPGHSHHHLRGPPPPLCVPVFPPRRTTPTRQPTVQEAQEQRLELRGPSPRSPPNRGRQRQAKPGKLVRRPVPRHIHGL